jgi:hypothetical protein
MVSEQRQHLKSILLINDYLSVCKLSDPNCQKAKLVRMYLCRKITDLLHTEKKKSNLFSFLF